MKLSKKQWGLVALAALPGGLVVGVMVEVIDLFSQLATGGAQDDLRLPLIYATLRVLKPVTPSQVKSALAFAQTLMVIAQTENSRAPNNAVGDTSASAAPGGPSISPWQLERINAEKLGFFSASDGTSGNSADQAARDEYAALAEGAANDVGLYTHAYRAAVFFNGNVWPQAGGDLTTALEMWNGGPNGPNNSQAQAYGAKGAQLAVANGWNVGGSTDGDTAEAQVS